MAGTSLTSTTLLPVAEGVPCCCARPWALLPLSYQASLLFAWSVFWVASI
jgi:hypothetical protein